MRQTEQTTIGGWTYTVKPLPAGQGLHLMTRLSKLLGGALAGLMAGGDGSAIGRAVEALVDRADPDAVVAIARELAGSAELSQPGGKAPAKLADVFDVHFAGDYLPMFEFLKFVLEVNYGPFVDALKARLGRGGAGAA